MLLLFNKYAYLLAKSSVIMANLEPMVWDEPIHVAEQVYGLTQEQSQALHNLHLFQESYDLQDNFVEVFAERILDGDVVYMNRWNQMGVLPHCNWCAIPFHPELYPGTCSSICQMRLTNPYFGSSAAPSAPAAPSSAGAPEVSAGECRIQLASTPYSSTANVKRLLNLMEQSPTQQRLVYLLKLFICLANEDKAILSIARFRAVSLARMEYFTTFLTTQPDSPIKSSLHAAMDTLRQVIATYA